MPKPKRHWEVRFTVRGNGPFPEDMLRYDHCEPATQEDVFWVTGRYIRELMLKARISHPSIVKSGLFPTKARWDSFGWGVTEVYKPTLVGEEVK
jgi:hypothetical protein